ncbi:intraflagellar transport protein 27 homolog [Clytia hemisphaerica]|uniref:Uncharacterized protein n=1 Tax=Clytia hemisphaerica TaxID=252671 RepID=A0A7M5X0Q4_9CNID
MPAEIKRALNYRAKCLIIGDSTVGKSALTQVFCSDGVHYPKNYSMTTGVEFVTKQLSIASTLDSVEFFLYDSAGKEEFGDIVDVHMKDAKIIVLVYDVTNIDSFENLSEWYKKLEAANNGKTLHGAIIGNKVDLTDRQVVTSEMGQNLADQLHLHFFECSAKDMRNIDAPFQTIAKDYYDRVNEVPS